MMQKEYKATSNISDALTELTKTGHVLEESMPHVEKGAALQEMKAKAVKKDPKDLPSLILFDLFFLF
jgi:hypothetical protein